jgi:hypothetical protein
MNSPKYIPTKPTEPNSAGKLPTATIKPKVTPTMSESSRNIPTNKAQFSPMQKQLSPVSKPL